jgi:hypothetical protein
VLDEISAQVDANEQTPIGAQFWGLARDLRRRVGLEDIAYDAAVRELVTPVRDRLRRYPRRAPRQEMLAALVQGWRFMDARDWRLSIDAKLDKGRASVVERRLIASHLKPIGDRDWNGGFEQDVAVIHVEMSVNRNAAKLASKCVTTISLHAIARRFQRGADSDVAAVLHDINLAGAAAETELLLGAGYRVRTDGQGGGWRGRVINHTIEDGSQRAVLAIRTWMDR